MPSPDELKHIDETHEAMLRRDAIIKLTDIAFEQMTVEQVLHDVYRYDASTQIRALNGPRDGTLYCAVTLNVEVPVPLAQAALESFEGVKVVSDTEQQLLRAQRAFNQNPTPAMSSIIRRLASMVRRERKKV